MRFESWADLEKICPIENGIWDKDKLYEYLVQSCNRNYQTLIDDFFAQYKSDETLADLLFRFLLDDDYDGSDSQMGAARCIAKLDRELLKKKKDFLLQAQKNEVFWKRQFQDDKYLEWL